MDAPTFPRHTAVPVLRAAWETDKCKTARLILSDSGLTRRLNREQMEQLSRIAQGVR